MLSETPVSHFRMPGVKNEPQFGIAFNFPPSCGPLQSCFEISLNRLADVLRGIWW